MYFNLYKQSHFWYMPNLTYMQARPSSIHLKILPFILSHYLIKISEASLNY